MDQITADIARETLTQAPSDGCSRDQLLGYIADLQWAVKALLDGRA